MNLLHSIDNKFNDEKSIENKIFEDKTKEIKSQNVSNCLQILELNDNLEKSST